MILVKFNKKNFKKKLKKTLLMQLNMVNKQIQVY